MLVTNFDLQPDAFERIARRRRVFRNGRRAREFQQAMESRYFRVENLDHLMQLRVRKEAPWTKEKRGQVLLDAHGEPVLKEGCCVVLLDEAHRWMNARSWSQQGREKVLEFFALARKHGFVVYLGSQRAENLDVQVRSLYEDHIQLENLKHSARLLGVRVIPFNFFLAAWSNHGWPGKYVKEERYRLSWHRHLYDTMDLGSFTEVTETLSDGDGIWLPRQDGEPIAKPAAAALAAAASAGGSQPAGGPLLPPPDPSFVPGAADVALSNKASRTSSGSRRRR